MNRRSTAEPLLWHAFTALVILGLAWAFYAPALAKTGGLWPAPLDDVYIHFGFARSAALGRPFQWIPGNGFSSGGTSLTYPLLLAPGYWLGFRGANMGLFAALLACACLFDLCRSARALALGSPRWVAWIAPPLLLAVPLLDWSLFSGMETALFYAVLGRALLAVRGVEIAPPHVRPGAQLRAGAYCALLVATRPESVAVALPLGVAVAHAAGSLGTLSSLARGAGPTIAFLAGNAAINKIFTSEWGAAGAIRKLLTANPYTTPLDIAPEIVRNVVALRAMALESALGVYPASMAVPLLAGIALLDRRARRLAVPLVIGVAGALLLASLNATARFQNLRYASPSIAMLLLAALLGASSLASKRGKVFPLSAALLAGVATLAPSRWFPIQIDHFARSSANIAGQQVEVAARIAALSPPARVVLVGDAGAIPYLSGVRAIDGLGLGGYRGMPFARASVHGVPAVVELIERLDPSERPDILALYPSWWQGLSDTFGRKIDAVKIADNVICAADEKVIYRADWAALELPGEARAGAVDALDVADLIDERAHHYEAPVPRGGYVIGFVLLDTRTGAPGAPLRFDAGRIVPEGRGETFRVSSSVARGPAELAMRTDEGGEVDLRVEVARGEATVSVTEVHVPARSRSPGSPGQWFEVKASLPDISGGDRVQIFATRGFWRSFHLWLLRR
ncbi:MAG TPA: hypothetical protein VE093_12165 [Polyangiaceae bacterium]|nr:hypothetical protein [Polyangiaceae bacterium]